MKWLKSNEKSLLGSLFAPLLPTLPLMTFPTFRADAKKGAAAVGKFPIPDEMIK